jgi:integrase
VDSKGRNLAIIGVSTRVIKLARKAGMKLSMKSLRQGFGCRYAGKVPAQVLHKLMRHANIRTTMDYYANVDDAAREAVLGPGRNSLRNSSADPKTETVKPRDANSSLDGTNSPSVN